MVDKSAKSKKEKETIEEAFEQIVNTGNDTAVESERAVGVDIGTSKIVIASKNSGRDQFASQRNAFLSVEYSKFTQGILEQNKITHSKIGDMLVVYGDGAEVFANMLNTETKRPMKSGLLNPKEDNAIEIMKEIINDLVTPSNTSGTPLCFSIPGVPKDTDTSIIYHEAILKRLLDKKGYNSKSINEGLAVVFSELEKENFTGIGISAGGGMCNVCLSYLSIPHLSFSIKKGGDYIDNAVASITGEVNPRVRHIKENSFDLMKTPENEIEDALLIYYDDLIMSLVKAIKESIAQTSKIPKVDSPLPIVLSGGTVKPSGFKKRFETFLEQSDFPLDISEVRIADDPLNATARGALIAAMYED